MSDRVTWVVASANRGKVAEIEEILAGYPVKVASLAELGPVDFPEEGLDYTHNAIEKARAAASQLRVSAVADDSGLEVEALDGRPGPLSARYGGEGLSDSDRVAKLLEELASVPAGRRGARFVCAAALATADGEVLHARGECEGEILLEPVGSGGFGYDPIFRPSGYEEAASQLEPSEKNRISHRGRAFAALWDAWRSGRS